VKGFVTYFKYPILKFEVHLLVARKVTMLWDVTLCSLVDINQEKLANTIIRVSLFYPEDEGRRFL
jgi:hypothetical protein